MDSIEQDEANRDRFEFNRPLGCVKLHFGRSTSVLPKLGWSNRTILWLDYDGKLSHTVISDIAIFCENARSGSVLIISVNAKPERKQHERRVLLQGQLKAPHKIPLDVTDNSLGGWGTAKTSRRIIYNEIAECIARVNNRLPNDQNRTYAQLFNFHYKDSAEMLTTGGVIFSQSETSRFTSCGFDVNYDFIRTGADPYHIDVPNLTFRELHYLNRQLPKAGSLLAKGVPQEDVEKYAKIYRYFPRFTETEFY